MHPPAFKIKQCSKLVTSGPADVKRNLWRWSVWVDGNLATLERIAYVVYSLHTAFPGPNRIVRERARGFRLDVEPGNPSTDTWGAFSINVRVVLRDGPTYRELVQLALEDASGKGAGGLLELPENATVDDYLRLAKRLKSKGAFSYARDVLARARRHPNYGNDAIEAETVLQQLALCTYKDPMLPVDARLADALAILGGCDGGLMDSADPETLGIVGAVYKRLWEVDGQRRHLEESFRFYRRGYDAMVQNGQRRSDYDGGAFTGVNAAFVADLLLREEGGPFPSSGTNRHAAEAQRIRRELESRLRGSSAANWWHYSSLAEVCLGLAHEDDAFFAKAGQWIAKAMALPVADDWERESTAKQLTALVELHTSLYGGDARRRDWAVVAALVPENPKALERPVRGKLGVALSGGGFRASLFHIGVLARLAELDLLRQVEVLSCVSGGSIIGAQYYLALRHLLQSKTDAELSREDYIDLVKNVGTSFLAGVQRNVRMGVAASLEANWKMLLQPRKYSRTRRIGELYEEYLFSAVEDGGMSRPRWLNDLFINPRQDDGTLDADFSPKLHNWRRRAPVPILVLNATTLNTGRNWQFTASSMGESVSYGSDNDATERLAPVYYSEAPAMHQEIRLGHAVAASACVPGVFDPLTLDGLFSGRTVRLVDGGVHDNQGTRALLDHDCSVLVVSDASGQMNSIADPGNGTLGVVTRMNSVLQARVRVAQHQEIVARRRARLLRDEVLVHLKLGLEAPLVLADGVTPAAAGAPEAPPNLLTDYGIARDVQTALAGIRTDLDSFSDREAYALMTSGYRSVERVLLDSATFGALEDHRASWPFLGIEPAMQGRLAPGVTHKELLRHLTVGSQVALKVWRLHRGLRAVAVTLITTMIGLVVYRAATQPTWRIAYDMNLETILLGAAALAVGAYSKPAGRVASYVTRWTNARAVVKRVAVGAAMGTIGFLMARLHLAVFDRLFLRLGRVPRSETTATPLVLSPGGTIACHDQCEARPSSGGDRAGIADS